MLTCPASRIRLCLRRDILYFQSHNNSSSCSSCHHLSFVLTALVTSQWQGPFSMVSNPSIALVKQEALRWQV